MKVFATYNIKGGVGKTATAVNLAYLSALEGARTLIWDLDPQGAATFYFRIQASIDGGGRELIRGRSDFDLTIRGTDYPGLDLLPADFSYRKMDLDLKKTKRPTQQLAQLLLPLAFQYDHLFLDCAPSISLVSEGVFVAADVLLVPTIPTTLSIRTLEQLENHLRSRGRLQPKLLPFFCMVDRRKALHRRICQCEYLNSASWLKTPIPYSSLIEQMGLRRAPVCAFAPSCPPAKAYDRLWQEIQGKLEHPAIGTENQSAC
ncbi:MAG: ParA family protein [Acidobacteriota bacterium]